MIYADKVKIGCNVTRIDALIIADTSVDTCPGDYNDPVWGGDEDEASNGEDEKLDISSLDAVYIHELPTRR